MKITCYTGIKAFYRLVTETAINYRTLKFEFHILMTCANLFTCIAYINNKTLAIILAMKISTQLNDFIIISCTTSIIDSTQWQRIWQQQWQWQSQLTCLG